jgi:hypothetical protein
MDSADEKIGQLEDELRQVRAELDALRRERYRPHHRAVHLLRVVLEETDALPGGEAAIRRALTPRGDILLPDLVREVMTKYRIAALLRD